MQIDRIRITNFKSIESLDLNFQELRGMWEISGIVGSGKTTIGEAILYGLFGSVKDKTHYQFIMWGKKHAMIETWVYCRGTRLYIKREINAYGLSPLIVIKQDTGEEIVGSNKRSIQSILETELYDVSRQSLELLCIISFNNFKSLSTLNPNESRNFLNPLLSFDRLDQYIEYCKEKSREYEQKIHDAEIEMKVQQSTLQALQTSDEPIEDIKPYESELMEKKTQLEELRKQNTESLKTLRSQFNTSSAELKVIETSLRKLKTSIKASSGAICPTCGQPIDENHRRQLQEELNVMQQDQQRILEQADKDVKRLREQEQKVSNEESILDQRIRDLEYKIRHIKSQKEERAKQQQKLSKIELSLKKFDKDIYEYRKELMNWQKLKEILSSTIRSNIISSMLPSINRYISHYVRQMHQNYIVQFDENFKCSISNSFGEMISISSLSTGQRKVIDVIVILAFIKTFISQIKFNVFFLDELIGNLDADMRDMMCNLLRETLNEETSMFLISHSPINQQYLNGIIRVVRVSEISQYTIEELQCS